MATFLAVVSGVFYLVGLLLLAPNLYLLQRELLSKPQRFLSVLPLQAHIAQGRVSAFLALVPHLLLVGLAWPILVPLMTYLASRLGFSVHAMDQAESRETFLIAIQRGADGVFFRAFVGATILGASGLTVAWPAARPVLLLWLGLIWLMFLLWLLSYFLPNNSFSLSLRLDPDRFRRNLLSLMFLLGFAFPVASSVLAVHLDKAPFTWTEVLKALKGIYVLGGVLWEGPKAALGALTSRPGDLVQLLTGLLLYLVVITKLKSLLTDRFSPAELLTAAASKLNLGDRESAEKLLDRLPDDDANAWALRIVGALQGGRFESARALARAKVDDLRAVSNNLDVAVCFYLATLTLSWKTPRPVQEEIWKSFVAAGPDEEELVAFWTLLNGTLSQAPYVYSLADFQRVAQERGFFHAEFILRLVAKDVEPISGLIERIYKESSLSPAVRLLIEVLLVYMDDARMPEQTKGLLEQRLEHLSRMLDQARRVLPLNLAALSLAFLRSLATRTQDEHLVAWVQKEAALHKEKVLLQPNGQKLWAGFLSMQSELQRAIG